MSTNNSEHSSQSTALLLAEHQRIAALYQHNAEMGDKYVTTYLTAMSLIIALLVGLSKLGASTAENISIELALMVALSVVGFSIFRRIIARRIHMIEYLRAINRINHYFVVQDPSIQSYLYWGVYDSHPIVHAKGTFLGGLRDIMGVLNSLSIGVCVYLLIHLTAPQAGLWWTVGAALGAALLTLGLLTLYGAWLMKREDKKLHDKILYGDPTPPDPSWLQQIVSKLFGRRSRARK
jgi:hypothetical protein